MMKFDLAAPEAQNLRQRSHRLIFEVMTNEHLTLRAATIKAAVNTKAEALAKGWTPEQAYVVGCFVAQVGAEIAADAVLKGIVTVAQIRES